jgi:hypothetical protein
MPITLRPLVNASSVHTFVFSHGQVKRETEGQNTDQDFRGDGYEKEMDVCRALLCTLARCS